MYYGHLSGSNFVPIIKKVIKKGRGYSALLVNEGTGFSKEISFTELQKLLNKLSYGYRVSTNVVNTINIYSPNDLPLLLNRVKTDIRLGICFIENS